VQRSRLNSVSRKTERTALWQNSGGPVCSAPFGLSTARVACVGVVSPFTKALGLCDAHVDTAVINLNPKP
jgi:hypothetical protein